MPPPAFSAIDPLELDRLMRVLQRDPDVILDLAGLNRPRPDWNLEEVEIWREALRQAMRRADENGPDATDALLTGLSFATAMAGLVLLAPPIGVAAAVAGAVAIVGGGCSVLSGIRLIRKDNAVIERAAAIERAQHLISERLGSGNAPDA